MQNYNNAVDALKQATETAAGANTDTSQNDAAIAALQARIDAETDPAKKAEVAKLLAGRSATFPAKLERGKWYALVVETVGDEMRVMIDGKPAGYLKSSGIAHATKSKIELGVAGKDGYFDDIKVWNAEPAKR